MNTQVYRGLGCIKSTVCKALARNSRLSRFFSEGNFSEAKNWMNPEKKKVVIGKDLPDTSLLKKSFLEKYDVHIYENESSMIGAYAFLNNKALGKGHTNINKEFIDLFTSECKIISNQGVGVDHIDHKYASSKGIWVTNTPGVVGPATADLTIAHLLNISRRFSESERWVRENKNTNWQHLGHSISGKTLGLIGFGTIGQETAKRASNGFGMKVIYYQRNQLSESEEGKLNVTYSSLDQLLGESDYISLHIPHTSETNKLIDANAIAKMKDGVFIINTSRGKNIDEQALVDALKSGKVAGAGLDVFENEPDIHPELFTISNVSLTPHTGTATIEARTEMNDIALRNIEAVLEGRPPVTPVNLVI